MSTPRVVRNFWIDAMVAGREDHVAFGPKGAGDGFELTIYQRKEGKVTEAARIVGAVVGVESASGSPGKLVLSITSPSGRFQHVTDR